MNELLNNSVAAIELLNLPKFGSGVGLHRMVWIFDQLRMSDWWERLDVLKITGSKGKGSTSALCAAILSNLGLRVGLFTSPHLLRFNARIKIDCIDVDDAELAAAWNTIKGLLATYRQLNPDDSFGAFEAFTAVAFAVFSQRDASVVVCEAGIGGRYDSTRPLPGLTGALTSVELEHAELLGGTTELIAYDKADICPPGGTLLVGRVGEKLISRLRDYCRLRSVRMKEAASDFHISDIEYGDGKMSFAMASDDISFGRVSTPLIGEHQAGNVTVAVATTRDWLSRNRPDITSETFKTAVIKALATVRWPGRLEKIAGDPDVVIDVGHTPNSMLSIAATIKQAYPGRQVLLLTGVSKDKNAAGVLAGVVPIAATIVCTSPHHKGLPVEKVEAICRQLRPDVEVISESDISTAVARALKSHVVRT
jgi:dihydrofolate synthase/folylpolyglutamate synthase